MILLNSSTLLRLRRQNTFEFVDKQVIGNFDYGTKWQGANYYQVECLKFLFEEEALSFESSNISIDTFLREAVMPTFKVKESQARNKYMEMKRLKLLDSKQDGQNNSKVWLNFTPKTQNIVIEGDKGSKGYTTYNEVFENKNTIIKALQSLQPLQSSKDKIDSPETKEVLEK